MNKIGNDLNSSRYYSLVFNGESHDLIRGACRSGMSCNLSTLTKPNYWEWITTDGSFLRVRAEEINAQSGRGGSQYGIDFKRYKWVVWTTSGTRYEFDEDAWQGWISPDVNDDGYSYMETYKWYLKLVEDTHGNRINYSYTHVTGACSYPTHGLSGTADKDVYPTTITWGGNVVTGAVDRYKVDFVSTPRTLDTTSDSATNMCGPAPTETQQLLSIKVSSMQSATWELVRQYNLGFESRTEPNPTTQQDYYLRSDASVGYNCNPLCVNFKPDYPTVKMTLRSIQRIGNDGTTALPATTFDYGMTRGTGFYPNGSWNRLTRINNNQGGVIDFTYETIGSIISDSNYKNTRRITSKTVHDGYGQTWDHTYTWNYTYSNPAYNHRGSALDGGPYTYPNSATLWYNTYATSSPDRTPVHKKFSEFRGHSYVVEEDPNHIKTEHWFYQGDIGNVCTLPTSGNLLNDSCFQQLRDREFLKGKEYKSVVHVGNDTAGPKLQQIDHAFTLEAGTLAYNWDASVMDDSRAGLWRAFVYESQTTDTAYDGSGTGIAKTTAYQYETTYGNLILTTETDNGVLTRKVGYAYLSNATPTIYIVDRRKHENIKDGSGNWLARTVYSYDNDSTYGPTSLGTKGELTLVRKLRFSISPTPPAPGTLPTSIQSSDVSYGYDTYGNQTTTTTYSGYGVIDNPEAATPTYYNPLYNNTARTTTTTYDSTFHVFPTVFQQPTTGAGVTLTEQGGYSGQSNLGWRMGVLTSVTDPNGNVTTAEYDTFGRMVKLRKPGDEGPTNLPTLEAIYSDNEIPFKYTTIALEATGTDTSKVRYTRKFYDGMGRQIQTKTESKTVGSFDNIVVDTVYDGVGQATQQSQPRYVAQTDPAYRAYLQPGSTACTDATERWTCTQYDGLGRATLVTAPDATTTQMTYALSGSYRSTTTVDAKSHKTEHRSDLLGRLRQVVEYSGNNGTEGAWASYSTTSYTYNPLDLLTNAQDGMGKNIVMQYDSLGRKTQMTDITMGTWNYQYNVDGSLQQQTDPKSQTISFQYDELARLTRKNYPDSTSSRYVYDGTGVANGKGQRTSMGRYDASSVLQSGTDWTYTARGQQATSTYTVAGLTGTRAFSFGYDAAGRNTSITYPNGEQVGYGYDEAWHQYSMAYTLPGPVTGNYVYSSLYTALDQPIQINLGSTGAQTYTYNNVMARLTNTQVLNGTPILNKSYQYDAVGNVSQISNAISSETQNYTYDHRDRLASWNIGASTENYTYDVMGNITQRAALTYTYDYTRASGNQGGPYALRSFNGNSYTYDADGNMAADGTRTYNWSSENLPTSIVSGGVTESYTYDAEGERVKKVRGAVTTYYIGGLYEEQVTSLSTTYRYYYSFSGQTIAQREFVVNTGSNTLKYLHGDHLGSVSLVTSSTGASSGVQEFDPWGKVRAGGTVGTQTVMNYTGQKLDGTGLLYYHARMYDPSVGRFVSPDSIVPGASSGVGGAGGSVGAEQNSKLTVDFHESGYASSVAGENAKALQKGFWFQLSSNDKQRANVPWGPQKPQALNRYSYVVNNPLRYVDPLGHYNYTYSFWVGHTSDGVSAKGVMTELKKHAQEYFPFKITPTSGCAVIAKGCTYILDPGIPGSQPYTVVVSSETDTSFTFKVTECNSCFAAVGSTVTFSTYERDGDTYIQMNGITAEAKDAWEWMAQLIEQAGAYKTWKEMSDKLRAHYPQDWPHPPSRYVP